MHLKIIVAGRGKRTEVDSFTLHRRHFFLFLLFTVVQQLPVSCAQFLEPERVFFSQNVAVTQDNSTIIFPTRTSTTIQVVTPTTTETTSESPTLVIPPSLTPDRGGNNRNVITTTVDGVPVVTNTVIVIPSKTITAKLTVTDDMLDPTEEPSSTNQPTLSSAPANDSSFLSAVNVTALAIIAPIGVVLAIAGIWVVRKWKLSPSRRFEEKFASRYRGPRTAESDTVFLRELNA